MKVQVPFANTNSLNLKPKHPIYLISHQLKAMIHNEFYE